MRQVKSQALRTGVNQDWGVSAFAAAGAGKARVVYIHQLLKAVSRYPVMINYSASTAGSKVSVVFYKYIQRARYRRSVLHRIRSGIVQAGSLEAKVKQSHGYTFSFARLRTAKLALQGFLDSTVSLAVNNVYAIAGGPARLDLMKLQHFYVFNRYKNLLYLLDLIQSVQITGRFGARPLFADVFSKGLIRNRRKGQRRFLRLTQSVINHARETAQVQYRPDGWRMEVYGKLDGQLRAKRHLLTFGHVSYQKLPVPMNYTQRTIDTKFGAFGLKLWTQIPTISLPMSAQFTTPTLNSRKPRNKSFRRKFK